MLPVIARGAVAGPDAAGRCRRREKMRGPASPPLSFSVFLNLCKSGVCRPTTVTFLGVSFLCLSIPQRAIETTERCRFFSLFSGVGIFILEKTVVEINHRQPTIILHLAH